MVKYLLDTCVVIAILRADASVQRMVERKGIQNCGISELTMAELYDGPYHIIAVSQDRRQLLRARNQLKQLERLKTIFPPLPWEGCGECFAREHQRLRSAGEPLEDMDLLLGAYAIAHKYTLVTGNVRHFERMAGLRLENWLAGN